MSVGRWTARARKDVTSVSVATTHFSRLSLTAEIRMPRPSCRNGSGGLSDVVDDAGLDTRPMFRDWPCLLFSAGNAKEATYVPLAS